MSRDFWQRLALGTAALGLAGIVMAVRARRRRRTVWGVAERTVREGGRLVRRGATVAVDRSRALGRRMLPKAVR